MDEVEELKLRKLPSNNETEAECPSPKNLDLRQL